MKAEAEAFARELGVLRRLVPTENEVPALLEVVSSAARRAGLELSDVQPDGVVNGDQFDTYKYKLGVTGPYHQVGEFLANVGSLPRIVAPINLTLAPTSRVGRAASRRRTSSSSTPSSASRPTSRTLSSSQCPPHPRSRGHREIPHERARLASRRRRRACSCSRRRGARSGELSNAKAKAQQAVAASNAHTAAEQNPSPRRSPRRSRPSQ